MIVGPHIKQAIATALDDPAGFRFTTTEDSWQPKMFMFLDASTVDADTTFEFDDYCGNEVTDIVETSRFYLWAVSIPEDDAPDPHETEIDLSHFVGSVLALVAGDITLGVEVPGVRSIRTAVRSNETSTKQMQSAGGQFFNAARAVLEIEVTAHLKPSALTT